MQTEMLKRIASANPTAEGMFYCFSFRERQHPVPMKLSRFKQQVEKLSGISVDTEDYVRTFEELEKAGCGQLVRGRGGAPIRFVWKTRISDVGQAGLDGASVKKPVLPAAPARKRVITSSSSGVRLRTTVGNKTIEANMDIKSFLEFLRTAG